MKQAVRVAPGAAVASTVFASLCFWMASTFAATALPVDPRVWEATKLDKEVVARLQQASFGVVKASDGSVDIFHTRTALLLVPEGADLQKHLQESGLKLAGPGPLGRQKLSFKIAKDAADPSKDATVAERRKRRQDAQRKLG